jgi:hypothetical protein
MYMYNACTVHAQHAHTKYIIRQLANKAGRQLANKAGRGDYSMEFRLRHSI